VIEGNPLTNYAIYLLLLVQADYSMFGILNRAVYKTELYLYQIKFIDTKIVLSSRFIPIILSLAIVCWVLNTKQPMVGSNGNFVGWISLWRKKLVCHGLLCKILLIFITSLLDD